MKFILKNQIYIFIILINVLSFIFICFPFLQSSKFLVADQIGHVFATTYMRDHLLPDISGWNPFQNLGYPQGSHYPPLVQYVVANISSLLTFDIADIYKWLIVLTILALPWSIYYLSKKLTNKGKTSNITLTVVVIITFLSFIFLPSTFGGSLKSVFQTGLINNFYTIPILYLYLGLLLNVLTQESKRISFVFLGVILSILILSHLVSGLVAAVITLVLIGYKILRERKWNYLIIPLVSLLLCAFYVIPYILNSRYLTASKPVISSLPLSVLILIIGVIFCFLSIKFKKRSYLLFIVPATILSLVPLADSLIYRFVGVTSFGILNAYRILPFSYFLIIPILIFFLVDYFSNRVNRKIVKIIYIGIIIVGLILIGFNRLELTDKGELDNVNIFTSRLPSNFLDLSSRYDIWDYHRIPSMNLSSLKYGNFSLIGQFEESSYLNHFAMSLKTNIDTSVKSDKVSKRVYIEDLILTKTRIEMSKDLFNIGSYILLNSNDKGLCNNIQPLTNAKLKYNSNGTYKYRDDTYSICDEKSPILSDINVYEGNEIFKSVEKTGWNSEVINWWQNDDPQILVEDFKEKLEKGSNKLDIKSRLAWDKNYQSFSFNIPTDNEKWTLVKVQYNPRWKAYSNNTEIKVYRVSPSMMLLKAKGNITFKYQFDNYETILKYVALLTLLSITLYSLYYKFLKKR